VLMPVTPARWVTYADNHYRIRQISLDIVINDAYAQAGG